MTYHNIRSWLLIIPLMVGVLPFDQVAAADLDILGAHYRADRSFPAFHRFWFEECPMPDAPDSGAEPLMARHTLGGYVHVFVRNRGTSPVKIEDVLLEGMSLAQSIAFSDQRIKRKFASIFYAEIPSADREKLVAAGEPVWWKVDPERLDAGHVGHVVIRMRQQPSSAQIDLSMQFSDGAVDVPISTREVLPRMASVAFSRELDQAYLYVERVEGVTEAPVRVEADGRDVTRHVVIAHDPAVKTTLVTLRFKPPLKPGEMHCFQVTWPDGGTASAAPRVWSDEFAYGMWGGPPISEDETERARGYIQDLVSHHINVQMPQLGSRGVAAFFKSPEGQRYCETMGLRKIIDEHQKWGTPEPYAFFIHDEPDAGDYLADNLKSNRKVGALAQWAIGHSHELREKDPSRPQLLNINNTYRPENYYTYGQLPDIFATDPYYQNRIMRSYTRDPCRLALYLKPTFLYGTATISHWACAPNPLHIILYAVRPTSKDEPFRFPTPEEKRIEAYYALAGGARGLSYWWYSPAKRPVKSEKTISDGVGAARVDPGAARLWKEIGLIGAEVRTAGPILMESCPVELDSQVSDSAIWPRFLVAGTDTLVMLAINEQYTTDRMGTVVQPVDNASVRINAPTWMNAVEAFEISADGVKEIACRFDKPSVSIDLGRLELTRLVVLTQEKTLRGRLHDLYRDQFADRVQRLQSEKEPSE